MWPMKAKPPAPLVNVTYFDASDERSVTRRYIRDQFWNAVRHVTPYVLESLRDDVFHPTYRKIHARQKMCHPVEPTGRLMGIRDDIEQAKNYRPVPSRSGGSFPNAFFALDLEAHQAFLDALTAWGARYNLSYDWVSAVALETMFVWAENPKALEGMLLAYLPEDLHTFPEKWTYTVKFGPLVLESFSQINYCPWMPANDYLETVMDAYAETLPEKGRDRRIRRMQQAVQRKMWRDMRRWERQGLKPSSKPTKRHLHAEWTAIAIIEKKTAKAISDDLTKINEENADDAMLIGERGVQKAVKQYCRLLGIASPLRRGRPRKTEDTP